MDLKIEEEKGNKERYKAMSMLHFCIDSKTSTNGYVSIHGLSAYKVQRSTISPHTLQKGGMGSVFKVSC